MTATEDLSKINETEIQGFVSDVLNSRDIAALKASTQALLQFLQSAESMHGYLIRTKFCKAVERRDTQYQQKTQGLKFNAVIIPPDESPAAMLPVYIKMQGSHSDFVDGLNRLISRCDEFVSPVHPIIDDTEIRAVLSAAQRSFGMIDIIAPKHPLRLHKLSYSHIRNNSECGILNGDARQSVIFLYHPHENNLLDSVYICAHEIGHALHYALTGDIDILPNGFDRFNDGLGVKPDTTKAKQECFADAAATAILGSPNSRLKSHLPTQFSKDISPAFVRYFKVLCENGRAQLLSRSFGLQ